MVRTQIQLTDGQVRALKGRAVREGVSMAELIRRCLDSELSRAPQQDDELHRQRALAAIGFLDSGPPDLAEAHDTYLDEAYLA